jgi:hypothetical protein
MRLFNFMQSCEKAEKFCIFPAKAAETVFGSSLKVR